MTTEVSLPSKMDIRPWKMNTQRGGKIMIEHQFTDPIMAFRELISNALDAQMFGKEVVKLTLDKSRFVCEDYGHGIKDRKKFVYLFDSVKERPEEAVGYFGLGRTSFLLLGDSVLFETYDNDVSWRVLMTPDGMTDPNTELHGKDTYVGHVGTRVTILNRKENLSDVEIISKMRQRFSLRILKGAKIYINNELLTPTFKFDHGSEQRIAKNIVGELIADEEGKGEVDVYIKYVYICTLLIDPTRAFRGWVNCNSLKLDISRDKLKEKIPEYDEFLSALRKEAQKFKKKDMDISEAAQQYMKMTTRIISDFMKEMGWSLPQLQIPVPYSKGKDKTSVLELSNNPDCSMGTHHGHIESPLEPGNTINAKETPKKQKADLKDKPMLRVLDQNFGNNYPVMFYDKARPGIIWNNISHPVNRKHVNAWPKTRFSYMAPYYARVLVQFDPQYEHIKDTIEIETKTDEIAARLLYSVGILTEKELAGVQVNEK